MKRIVFVLMLNFSLVLANEGIFDYLDSCSQVSFQHIVKLLKKQKNLKIYDKNGETPLTKLAKKLQNCSYGLKLAKLIIDKDRELIDMPNKDGDTPLIASLRKEKDKYLPRLFIKEGAEINLASKKDGKTPLMLAVLHKDKELVRILSDRFAKRGLKDKDNKTALNYAIENGYLKIAQKVYADKRGKFVLFDRDNKPIFINLTKRGFRIVGSSIDRSKILLAYVDKKIYKKLCAKQLKDLKIIAMINYDEKINEYQRYSNVKVVKFNEEFYKLLLKALRWRTPPMFLLRNKNGDIVSSGINEKFLEKIK